MVDDGGVILANQVGRRMQKAYSEYSTWWGAEAWTFEDRAPCHSLVALTRREKLRKRSFMEPHHLDGVNKVTSKPQYDNASTVYC